MQQLSNNVPLVMLQKSDSHYTKENERKNGNEIRASLIMQSKLLSYLIRCKFWKAMIITLKYVTKIVEDKKFTNNLVAGRYKEC